MKNCHPVQKIYEELRDLRIVRNQSEFSKMCGRTPMWFSCLKSRNLPLTSDAALTLAYRLRRIARNTLCDATHDRLIKIGDTLLNSANDNIEMRYEKHDEII